MIASPDDRHEPGARAGRPGTARGRAAGAPGGQRRRPTAPVRSRCTSSTRTRSGGGRVWRSAAVRAAPAEHDDRGPHGVRRRERRRWPGPVTPGRRWPSGAADARRATSTTRTLAAEARTLGPLDFPTRRLANAYFDFAVRRTLGRVPDGVTLVTHAQRAVDLRTGRRTRGDREVVVLEDGEVHHRRRGRAAEQPRRRPARPAVRRAGVVRGRARADLPAARVRGRPRPQRRCRRARTCWSAASASTSSTCMVLLTEGRGGRFRDATGDRLVYEPSGAEPHLLVGSRRGVPYHAKPTYRLRAGKPATHDVLHPAGRRRGAAARRRRSTSWRTCGRWSAVRSPWGYYRELGLGPPGADHHVLGRVRRDLRRAGVGERGVRALDRRGGARPRRPLRPRRPRPPPARPPRRRRRRAGAGGPRRYVTRRPRPPGGRPVQRRPRGVLRAARDPARRRAGARLAADGPALARPRLLRLVHGLLQLLGQRPAAGPARAAARSRGGRGGDVPRARTSRSSPTPSAGRSSPGRPRVPGEVEARALVEATLPAFDLAPRRGPAAVGARAPAARRPRRSSSTPVGRPGRHRPAPDRRARTTSCGPTGPSPRAGWRSGMHTALKAAAFARPCTNAPGPPAQRPGRAGPAGPAAPGRPRADEPVGAGARG